MRTPTITSRNIPWYGWLVMPGSQIAQPIATPAVKHARYRRAVEASRRFLRPSRIDVSIDNVVRTLKLGGPAGPPA